MRTQRSCASLRQTCRRNNKVATAAFHVRAMERNAPYSLPPRGRCPSGNASKRSTDQDTNSAKHYEPQQDKFTQCPGSACLAKCHAVYHAVTFGGEAPERSDTIQSRRYPNSRQQTAPRTVNGMSRGNVRQSNWRTVNRVGDRPDQRVYFAADGLNYVMHPESFAVPLPTASV